MKLIILATLVAFAFTADVTAVHVDGKWDGSVQKFDGTFTCQMTMTISGAALASSANGAADMMYLVGTDAIAGAAFANDEKMFACTATNPAGNAAKKWQFSGTAGTCSNYTVAALKPASPAAWADAEYDFNCTTTTTGGADNLADTKCWLSYDQGKLALADYSKLTKTGVTAIIAAGKTFVADFVNTTPVVAATVTEVTDKKCEDKSSATSSMVAGALALVGAAFF